MIKCPECGETLSEVTVVLKVSGWEHAGYRWDEDEEKFIYSPHGDNIRYN